jgi:hypothetical protein
MRISSVSQRCAPNYFDLLLTGTVLSVLTHGKLTFTDAEVITDLQAFRYHIASKPEQWHLNLCQAIGMLSEW